MNEVFLDTSYAIALSSETDEHHQKAFALSEELEKNKTKIITTRAVLLEVGNFLSKVRYRQAAVALLESFEFDKNVKIIEISKDLYEKAFKLFKSRNDKDWGLIDCLSFAVMKEGNLTDALTADEHFRQAGFKILLKDK